MPHKDFCACHSLSCLVFTVPHTEIYQTLASLFQEGAASCPVSGVAESSPADAQNVSPGVLFTAIIIQGKATVIPQNLLSVFVLLSVI